MLSKCVFNKIKALTVLSSTENTLRATRKKKQKQKQLTLNCTHLLIVVILD